MKFRTEIPTPKFPFKIAKTDQVLLFGSCFSDHIGNFFASEGFPTLTNPFGTLFNPMSIATALQLSVNQQFSDTYIDFFNEKWISYAHHGKFSHENRDIFLQNIENQLVTTHNFLKTADFLFLTFGTAWVFRLKKRNFIVANCHRIPAAEFERERLSINAITERYVPLFQEVRALNPNLKIILTVSPIRHLSDGFHENQLSKATLHLATAQLVDNQRVFYFPSYEIVQDDLRDYRFYAEDLCHVAPVGIQYVQEIVAATFFEK